MNIVLATNNPHKKEEFDEILSPHTVLLPNDLGLKFSFDETGTNYFENAYGKAHTLFKLIRGTGRVIPVLGDDSGLSVEALDGAPGLYSSRYGADPGSGEKLPAEKRNKFLLDKLTGKTERSAFFVCSLVLILSEYRFYAVQETLEGEIAEEPSGSGGFGYDPVFYIPEMGKTAAELSPEKKHTLSHRGKAGKVMMKTIEGVRER